MMYSKPPLSFEDQAKMLIQRGLIADLDELISVLSEVNYYRLSAYWYPFRDSNSENFTPGTHLTTIWHRYVFDRQLRLLVMDAIERVEVSVKTRLVNSFTLKHGAFGHLKKENFVDFETKEYGQLIQNIGQQELSSKETFVGHYHKKYSKTDGLPLWMACELMSFGNMLTFFRHTDQYMQREIAESYKLHAGILESWLLTLNSVRNLCAHHARLWNKTLGTKPEIPDKKNRPEFHDPISVNNAKLFAVLTILRYMLSIIAPQSSWQSKVEKLLSRYPQDVPLQQMGFPDNWQSCPVWRQKV